MSARARLWWKAGFLSAPAPGESSASDPLVEPSLTALCLCFCTLHTNEIPRTDPLVQVDYVRVVDLDIGASKSDNLRDQSAHHFRARLQNSSLQPRVRVGTAIETLHLAVVQRLIAREQHQGRGASPSPVNLRSSAP